jgi:transcriptional regulator with XRE-family HTH domain
MQTMKLPPVGRRVAQLRKAQGLTQVELAATAGLSPSLLAQIEQGKTANPTLATLIGLAKALGVSLGELAGPAPEEG